MFSTVSIQAKLIVLAVIVAVSFTTGWKVRGWFHDSQQVKATVEAKKIVKEALPKVEQNINAFEDKQVKERIVYRTIREKINESTTGNICFNPDSLSLWNDAIAGANNDKSEPTTRPGAVEENSATDEEILANATDNYETCNRNSDRQRALIKELNIYKGKMCVCTD